VLRLGARVILSQRLALEKHRLSRGVPVALPCSMVVDDTLSKSPRPSGSVLSQASSFERREICWVAYFDRQCADPHLTYPVSLAAGGLARVQYVIAETPSPFFWSVSGDSGQGRREV